MKKCKPSMRCAVARPWAMALMGKPELLLASTALRGAGFQLDEQLLLGGQLLGDAFDHQHHAAPVHVLQAGAHLHRVPAWVTWPAAASSCAMWGNTWSRRAAWGSTTVTCAAPGQDHGYIGPHGASAHHHGARVTRRTVVHRVSLSLSSCSSGVLAFQFSLGGLHCAV